MSSPQAISEDDLGWLSAQVSYFFDKNDDPPGLGPSLKGKLKGQNL